MTTPKDKHNPTRNGHCSGCTDPRSEGTHQMGTFEHPDDANDISAAYVQQPKLSERLRELHKTLLLEVYPDWVTDELDHCATEAEALEAQDAGMADEPVAWTTALALDVMKSNEGTPFGTIEAASKNLWGEMGVPLYRLHKGRASEDAATSKAARTPVTPPR